MMKVTYSLKGITFNAYLQENGDYLFVAYLGWKTLECYWRVREDTDWLGAYFAFIDSVIANY